MSPSERATEVVFTVLIDGCDCETVSPCELPSTTVTMPASTGLPSVCQGVGGVKPDQLSTAQQLNQTWEAALNAEKAMCSAATAAEDPLCNSRMEEKETECEEKRKTEQTACDAKKTTANTKCDKNKETWKKESEAECLKKTEEAEKCGSFFCFFFF